MWEFYSANPVVAMLPLTLLSLLFIPFVAAQSPQQIAAQYTLTASTTYPFPTSTSTVAGDYIVANWGLSQGRLQNNAQDLTFVPDPFPSSPVPGTGAAPSGPVLQVEYPAGSYSHDTGGTQFYALFNGTTDQQAMMVSYEIAFDEGFDFVKGGKLPGMRGGPSTVGCDGGNASTGHDCFSQRVMWRTSGAGEIYTYIPFTNNLCSDSDVICSTGTQSDDNGDEFGASIDRGSFDFKTSAWQRISVFVWMNLPFSEANGVMSLYYNDNLVITKSGLQVRAGEAVTAGGLWFSTFFGGDDTTWATPTTTHTYFRNLQVYAADSTSNLTGPTVTSSSSSSSRSDRQSSLVLWIGALLGFLKLWIG